MDFKELDKMDTSELDNAPELDEFTFEDPDKTDVGSDEEESEETKEDSGSNEFDSNNNYDSSSNNKSITDDSTEVNDTTDVDTNPNDSKILIDFGDGKVEADNIEELTTIASKALKDKNRFDRHKDDIAILQGIKEQGLSDQDLYLLVEAKKGNKQAIAKLLKEANVDPFDLDTEAEDIDSYKPNEYKVDPKVMEVKSIIDDVKQDETAFKTFNYVLNNDFSETDRAKAFEDPSLLSFIGELTKSKVFDQIAPSYTKRKVMGENPISALISSYDDFNKSIERTKQDTATKAKAESNNKATKRKKASEGVKKNTSNKAKKSIDDMTNAEFDAYYKSIVGEFN